MGPILLKPQSSGTITLRSSDPKDKPIIDPRYLTDAAGADRAALMAGLRMCADDRQITGAAVASSARSPRPLDATTPRRRNAGDGR